ncbi:MAG: hypothetical protein OXH36_02235 [Bdellovibrionales bacterium]|nr:hypothetical protein [Bdellovibrionales bacterium]
MNKSTISPVDEIWSLIKETQRNLKQFSAEAEKRQAEAEKRQAEAEKRQAEADKRQAEADKRRAEIDRQMDRTDQKIDKLTAKTDKQIAETGRQIDKLSAETNEQLKKTGIKLDKFIGDTGNRWGKLGENLVKGNLAQRLKERGIKVEAVVTNARKRGVEFDIIALNGKEVVVVEVKATLDPPDVDKFKKNIEQFKILWPDFKKKTVYGAMAFLLKSKRKAESLAEKQGFFVISATGDVIIKNEKNFKPKVFSQLRHNTMQ